MYIPSRFVKVVTPLAIAIALSACGGGSSFGGDSSGGGVTDPATEGERPIQAVVASIDVIPDSTQLLSSGTKPVTITVNPKDENGIVINDANVEFSVDKGATLIVNGSTAVLTPGSAAEGEEVTITVKSGESIKTITVKVIKEEEQVQGGEVVDAIDLRYDSKQLLADGSKPLVITAIAKNSENVAISADVKFSAVGNVTLEVSGNSATVTSDGAQAGETIQITAQSGNKTKDLDVLVIQKEELAESEIKLGSSSGDTFVAGELAIQDNSLEAGGQTSIKVFLVDTTNNNDLFTESTTISFNSDCIANGTASVSDVEFNAGIATVNYLAQGCDGTDTITATAVVNGKTITASGDVTIDTAVVGSISFDQSEPANIGLKGMGLNEVSAVSFTVLDVDGNPVINKVVNFSLSNNIGGAFLTNTTAKTDANGKVIARVHSGTKATTIKVLASVDGANSNVIKTESRGLVISTGVADDDSFSLSLQTLNPEALNYDGVVSEIYVQAADHFNNPVPEGTAVYFTTEAGSITSSCFIDDKGSCKAEWKSGGTRPSDGRSTITASIQGEETFNDTNDNGLLDETETFTDVNGDGKYNGLLCQIANPNCSDTKTIKISKQIDIVMSGSLATFVAPGTVEINNDQIESFNVEISDINGQRMPAGTTVEVSIKSFGTADAESPHTLVSESTFSVPNSNANSPSVFQAIVKDEGLKQSSILQIKVITPKGGKSVEYVNLVPKGTLQDPTLASQITLTATANKILADGTTPVIVTATAKDDTNNVLNGIPVEFSVDKDAEIRPTGLNTAELKPGTTAVNEVLTVTATIKDTAGNVIDADTFQVTVVESLDQTQSQAASLDFTASSRQLFSAGDQSIILSAVVKDKNNNTLTDEIVTFSVDNGATISVAESNTGVVKTANLTPGSKQNRDLLVTATVGSITKTILVKVVGTKLSVEGPASIAINKPTDYLFKLQDSADNPIAFTNVNILTDIGTIAPTLAQTNENGELKVTLLSATTSGTANVTATALNAQASTQVAISGNDFTLTGTDLNGDTVIDANDLELDLGISEAITVKWLVDTVAKSGETISVRTTRGSLFAADGTTPLAPSEVITDANGEAVFTIKSDTAGSATITAETSEGLTSTLNREFVATIPAYLNAQASPSLIAPNKSSTIITKVRDANDNPVKNVKVNFNLTDTVNGQLSNSQAVTDSLGRAQVSYTAGNSSSGLDGVSILTELNDTPAITDPVTLTVGGDALRIVLGTDELLAESGIFYEKTFGVIVTDSAGNPIKDQKVDFTITATEYMKGFMELVDTSIPADGKADIWRQNITTLPGTSSCPNEDFDNDGQLDVGEDTNNNGKLDPTQAATVTGSGTTDEQGKLSVTVVYPQSEALWSKQLLTAKTIVEGTEFVENTTFTLPMTAEDFKKVDAGLPNHFSPYGVATDCTNKD